jgi:hypothetical protein
MLINIIILIVIVMEKVLSKTEPVLLYFLKSITKECKGGECEKKIEKKKLEIDGNKK